MFSKKSPAPCQIQFDTSLDNYNQALIFLTSEIQKAYGFFLYRAIFYLQENYGLSNRDIIAAFGFTRQNLSKLAKKYRPYLEKNSLQ